MVDSKQQWKAWLYLSPAIVLLLIFTVWPIFNTVRMALLEGYNGLAILGGATFDIGFENFVKVISLDLSDRYSKIQQPTLLIWGDQDTETPLWMGRQMEKDIPDAGLVVLQGGTHFAYLEQVQRFNKIAHVFLMEEQA